MRGRRGRTLGHFEGGLEDGGRDFLPCGGVGGGDDGGRVGPSHPADAEKNCTVARAASVYLVFLGGGAHPEMRRPFMGEGFSRGPSRGCRVAEGALERGEVRTRTREVMMDAPRWRVGARQPGSVLVDDISNAPPWPCTLLSPSGSWILDASARATSGDKPLHKSLALVRRCGEQGFRRSAPSVPAQSSRQRWRRGRTSPVRTALPHARRVRTPDARVRQGRSRADEQIVPTAC